MKKTPRQTAYNLYFQTNLTQAQIAEYAGISTRTLYDWMKEGNWKTLKANSRIMPAQIVDDIYKHISHLNWKISIRDFDERYPTKEEADTLRKLILSIPKVKMNVSKGESAQAMVNFVSWLQTRNNDAAIFISDYIDEYLHAGRERGMEPYEFEYDAHHYYNPGDNPYQTHIPFEQRVDEEKKDASLRGSACPDDLPGKQPRQNTEEAQPNIQATPPSSPSLREASQALQQGAPKQSSSEHISKAEKSDQPHPQKPEENRNQIGSKSADSQKQQNTHNPTNNQPPNLKKLPDPTSENKKSKTGDPGNDWNEIPDRNDPDFIQKVFASWQKEIDKNKRRKNRY